MYLTITPLLNSRVVLATLLLMLDFLNTYSLPTGATVMTSMSTTVVEQSTTTPPITLDWSSNVSSMYPPSSPLTVRLGDELKINCPEDATSNIWIQKYLQQYEQCDCNTATDHEGVSNYSDTTDLCVESTTTRHVCQDEVLLAITSDSKDLNSALSFKPGSTYYFISYSPGDRALAGYSGNTAGGECLLGYKMAIYIQPNDPPTTTELVTTSTTMVTTTGPLTTSATTKVRVASTEPALQDTPFTGDVSTTTSGTVTLFNLNYLTIIGLLSLWCVSQ